LRQTLYNGVQLFQEKKFIVPISCTATQATMQGENLKRELLSNRLITSPFNNRENYRVGCSVGGYSNLAAGTIPIGANVYQDDDWVYVRDITGSYMSQANFENNSSITVTAVYRADI
jgi:hypothetical protein